MKLRTLLAAGTFTALIAGSAFAATDSVISTITNGLAQQGYTNIRVINSANSVKVEAYGPNGSIEQVYDAQGNLLRVGNSQDSRTASATGTTSGTSHDSNDHGSNDRGSNDHNGNEHNGNDHNGNDHNGNDHKGGNDD